MYFNKGLDFIEIMYIFLQISIGGLSSDYDRERPLWSLGNGILWSWGIAPYAKGLNPGPETIGNGPEQLALLAHK